jgi:HSP20 family molecular chaperone IbpA
MHIFTLPSIFEEFDKLENNFSRTDFTKIISHYSKDQKTNLIEIPLPGFEKDGIEVRLEGRKIHVNAEYKNQEFEISRKQNLKFNIRKDEVVKEAKYENGMLLITIEIEKPADESRLIELK